MSLIHVLLDLLPLVEFTPMVLRPFNTFQTLKNESTFVEFVPIELRGVFILVEGFSSTHMLHLCNENQVCLSKRIHLFFALHLQQPKITPNVTPSKRQNEIDSWLETSKGHSCVSTCVSIVSLVTKHEQTRSLVSTTGVSKREGCQVERSHVMDDNRDFCVKKTTRGQKGARQVITRASSTLTMCIRDLSTQD